MIMKDIEFYVPKVIEGTNITFLVPRVRGAIPNTFSGFTCRLLALVRSQSLLIIRVIFPDLTQLNRDFRWLILSLVALTKFTCIPIVMHSVII